MGEFDKVDRPCEWPYVLKPRWIHDLLLLWRRKQPYAPFIDQVSDYSVSELRDEAIRRRCVAWMADHFAPSRSGSTLNQNVWASYSHHFRAIDLAPAYLCFLSVRVPLVRQVSAALHGQLTSGMSIGRALLVEISALPGALDT